MLGSLTSRSLNHEIPHIIKLKSDNGKNLFLMQSLPFVTNLD